ncbi:MAG: cell envelope integrity protein TolA [Aliivibrio sp.]|uniref:cell envelope integrity protein TolA n=1 Tax=Aliivibrio sp. TaxID=1872443 RepID=UPI001A556F98|nr:cell envelope integrity protein TolA [Aliivibrio sp.]
MKNNNNYSFAITVSVILHLVLLALLLWGSDFSMSDREPTPNMIQAVVIDPNAVAQQAKTIRQQRNKAQKAEQNRLDKLRKQADELQKNRAAEEERIRKLKADTVKADKAARQAEADRKRKQDAANKAEKQRVVKEKAAKASAVKAEKAEADRIVKEKAAQKAAEKVKVENERAAKAEARRIAKEKEAKAATIKAEKEKARAAKAEADRKVKEAALNDIFAGLESETQQNSSAKQKYVASETDRYGAIYKQMIKDNLRTNASFAGKECTVRIKLSSSGFVQDVHTAGGDPTLCTLSKAAVIQVSSFPMSEEPDVAKQFRSFSLRVEL